jgi:alpha-beta hydrolase superfamily lysophospholipase
MPQSAAPTLLLLVVLMAQLGATPQSSDPNALVRQALQSELLTGDGTGPSLARYRLQLERIGGSKVDARQHQALLLPWNRPGKPDQLLGVNVFTPQEPVKGTLLFVHGYLSHSANFAYTFAYFSARGWRVVSLDLPGHGFSTGPRGDVESFGDYGDAVATWLQWTQDQQWDGPRVLLAHSLGTAACLEALRRPGTQVPDRIVFCAPLLRTDDFLTLTLAEVTLGWLFRDVPATFGWDGYLDGYVMPVHWFTALRQWLDTLNGKTLSALPLTVYSGDRDENVDEGWNLAEYRRLVPGVQVIELPGKGHLFLTATEDRQAFHEQLEALLASLLVPLSQLEPQQITLQTKLTSGPVIPLALRGFFPDGESKGSVLLIHGFMADSADFTYTARWFAARGWTAITMDLPGHGASGGPRYDIDEFADYGDAVNSALEWVAAQNRSDRLVVIAHSLGCAAALEACLRQQTTKVERMIFLAPLLRTTWWELLTLTQSLGIGWLPHNHWLATLRGWVDTLKQAGQIPMPLAVYQGDLDTVMYSSWNKLALEKVAPRLTWTILKGKDHWFHANPSFRDELLRQIDKDLEL